MKDLKTLLREGDPAADDSGLSPEAAAAIRRRVLNEPHRLEMVRRPWHQGLAVVAMIVLTIAAGVIANRRAPQAVPEGGGPAQAAPEAERRQFQFATPGGTRIIWVFDPEFQVKETVP